MEQGFFHPTNGVKVWSKLDFLGFAFFFGQFDRDAADDL